MLTGVYPDARPDRRYSIKETAAILGIHRNTLRKYTEAGEIVPLFHTAGTRQFYLGSAINEFWRSTITP